MADVVQNPAFKDEELARARQETLDGLMVSLRQPSTVGRYAMTRRLYGDGPYGSVPSPKSIAALTPATPRPSTANGGGQTTRSSSSLAT